MKNLKLFFIGLFLAAAVRSSAQYCTPVFTNLCSSDDYIDNFYTTGGITNISNLATGCNGQPNNYIYYSTMTASQTQGVAFNINVQSGLAWAEGFSIWVDWNGDGDFADVGEAVWNSGTAGTQLFTGTINVPVGATPGIVRMRVMCAWNTVPTDPCGSNSFGETEDYNFQIIAGGTYCIPPFTNLCSSGDYIDNFYTTGGITNISNLATGCNGLPNNYIYYSTMTASQTQGAAFNINVQSGLTWPEGFAIWIDWNGDGDFADAGEAVWNSGTAGTQLFTGTITVPLTANPGVKRMRVICEWNAVPTDPCGTYAYGETEDYNFQVMAGGTYCIPTFTNLCTSDDYINNFYTTGGIANISNLSTGCNGQPNNYIYYSTMTASQTQGAAFNINVQSELIWAEGIAIWIDWNGDGDFADPGEAVWNSGTPGTQLFTGTINVPMTATPGIVRMRVMCVYNTVPTDPCGTYTFGETEDYNFQVLPYNGPCSNIVTIPACGAGDSVTSNHSGSGKGWNITSCGFSTPGQERIFQFTPAVSGIYSIQVTSSSGGYIDYFYKTASLGCDSLNWTCIDNINMAGTWGSFTLTAGTTYYFLLDAESTAICNQTFYLNCPKVACPPNATIIENEPDCYTNYVDATNGGCNSTPNVFTELTGCNDVVCGKAGTFLSGGVNYRDTDWYRLILNGNTTVNMKAVADFPLQIFVIDLTLGCANQVTLGTASANAGDTAYISTSFGPGTLAYWVGPSVFSGVTCGSNYAMYCNAGIVTTPVTPVALANPSCGNTQLNAMTSPVGVTDYWQGTSCDTSTAILASIAYPVTTSGTYYVRAQSTALGCWSACSSLGVTINTIPSAAGTITGTSSICQNTPGVAYHIPLISGATSYVWNYSGTGVTINGTGANITIDFSASATSGDLTVYGTNAGCNGTTSAVYAITVNSVPGTAGSISGPSQACLNTSGIAYSVNTIPFAVSYTWGYSGTGVTINGTGASITIDFSGTATSGNLTVYGTNTCGNGTVSVAYPITVDAIPVAAGTITGTASVCQGVTNVAYNVPVILNAASYVWSYSGTGITINGNGPNITIDYSAAATSGNLTVYGTSICGNGTVSAPYAINVNSIPLPAGSITGTSTVCAGASGLIYSVPVITGAATYNWSYSGTGAAIFGTGNTIAINFNATASSGTLTVMGNNSCGNGSVSAGYTITVNAVPSPAGIITGTDTVCAGYSSIGYVVPSITGATNYHWYYSGTGAIINGNGNSVTISFPAGTTSGTLAVYGSNTCGNGDTAYFNIMVDPCTGIEENHDAKSIQIIPNPNPGIFSVEISSFINSNCKVEIINILGQAIKSETHMIAKGQNRLIMDLSGQPNGYYYLRISDEQKTLMKTFIINR